MQLEGLEEKRYSLTVQYVLVQAARVHARAVSGGYFKEAAP